ncbi:MULTISPECIES: restriction endonuclease subunit S [Arenibacter]|uniref:restriction endonuclease subunit S n=1 Tax=Arenibacter TaxID=178469 RepID=UPI001964DB65|nr:MULTISPECIES: restriction endonuclease subunit S [Arenibacter]
MELKQGYKNTDLGFIPVDWECVYMGDVGKTIIGLTYSPKDVSDYGTLVLRSSNVQQNQLKYQNNVFVDMDLPQRVIVREDDILICVRNGSKHLIGKCALIDKKAVGFAFGAFMSIYRSDFSKYIFHSFQSSIIQKQIDETMGATINQLTNKNLAEFKIPLPPLTEQKAITQVLSDTDNLIQALEQILTKKRALKQGAMQKLLTPKKDWEVKKLGEVLIFGSGKDYKHLKSGSIPVYGTGGVMTFVNDYLFEGESVGIGRKGTIDKPIFLNGKFWTVDTLFFTHSFINSDPKYIYYQCLLINWKDYNEASGVPSLSKNTLEQIEIRLPSLNEQTQIATILSDMDSEIAQLERKLSKYKLVKQGLMQELLTGRIRLI